MLAILLAAMLTGEPVSQSWPAFRGVGDSHTSAKNLPQKWGEGKNIAWDIELSGYGQSSPVVWGDSVFVTATKGEKKETLIVACYDLSTGKKKWVHEFASSWPVPSSNYVSRSAPTPAVDADHVYAFFESGDLIALDHAGKEQWQRSLTKEYGKYVGNHQLGSSPAITKDAVIILFDHSGPSYLLAADKSTGKNLWKTDRDSRVSWSSPVIASDQQSEQILISSNGVVEAYSAQEGKRIWWLDGLEKNTVASPGFTDGLVIVGSSQVGHCVAVNRDSKGKLSEKQIAWKAEDATSSFGSPLIHRGLVYFVNRAGVAYCLDVKSGKQLSVKRLPSSCWASPVAAGDHIYFFCKDGTTVVIKLGAEMEQVAENVLPSKEPVHGVAVVDGGFVVRAGEWLTCIGKPGT